MSFSLDDKTSAPDVFSSCSFIPHAHFETSSVMISCNCTLTGVKYVFVNVNAPNKVRDQCAFFEMIHDKWDNFV